MKEPYAEGLATHGGPDDHGDAVVRPRLKRWPGKMQAGLLNCEILPEIQEPSAWVVCEGNTACAAKARCMRTWRGRRNPSMHGHTLRENREIPMSVQSRQWWGWTAARNPRMYYADARTREV